MQRKKLAKGSMFLVLVLIITLGSIRPVPPAHADASTILYVCANATGSADGLSWDNAFPELQSALEEAEEVATDDSPVEIWVAAGTYTPTSTNGLTAFSGETSDRLKNFSLLNNVAVYGGFPVGGGQWDERNWETNQTILSGELGDPDQANDNCYHVLNNSSVNNSAILDGFFITHGYAGHSSDPYDSGAGVYNENASPLFKNVKITGNLAIFLGGGMYNINSDPVLENVIFELNEAVHGGGMFNYNSHPQLTDVTFTENITADPDCEGQGGAIFTMIDSSMDTPYLELTNVTFENNTAQWQGGAIFNYNDTIVLTDVEFIGNSSTEYGGAIENWGSLTIRDGVFTANSASAGAAIHHRGGSLDIVGAAFLENHADRYGGGLSVWLGDDEEGVWSGTTTVINAVFSGNSAADGGAIFNLGEASNFINITCSGNSAEDVGGAIVNNGADSTFVNITCSGNYAGDAGAAIFNADYDPVLTNCILWGNVVDWIADPPDNQQLFNSDGTPRISNCLIQDSIVDDVWDVRLGDDLGGNLDSDPLFVAAPGEGYGNLNLKMGSPAIDAGTNDPFGTGGTAEGILVDIMGENRFVGSVVDMGAYEFVPPPPPAPRPPMTPAPVEPETKRFGGSNRYETAAAISQSGWEQSDVVILARGNNYADALAGVSLAYKENAPVLLTETRTLHTATKTEILRLQAQKVFVLGGTSAISEDVVAELEDLGLTVERISGRNRYDTAVAIAKYVAPEGADQAVLAYGLNFPDALSVASYAAANSMPILLTAKNQIPAETQQAIIDMGIDHLVVVGGSGVILEDSLAVLESYERVYGTDRYSTSIAVAEYFAMSGDRVFVATGLGYADAITGAALAAREGCGLILVGTTVPDSVTDFLSNMTVSTFTILGGTGVISESVANQLAQN